MPETVTLWPRGYYNTDRSSAFVCLICSGSVSLMDSRTRLNELLPLIYDQLRAYASRVLEGEPEGLTLQTTEVVHEVYLRLSQLREICWESDNEIKRTAIGIMRRVLIDNARTRKAQKRTVPGKKLSIGTDIHEVPDRWLGSVQQSAIDLLDLDSALDRFAEVDPRKAEIVQMRYFGGLAIEDIANLLDLSPATVKRDWVIAKAWLFRELHVDDNKKP